jgi:hypothetical protein
MCSNPSLNRGFYVHAHNNCALFPTSEGDSSAFEQPPATSSTRVQLTRWNSAEYGGNIPPKRRALSEQHGITTRKTILWHVDQLLDNNREISNYTTAVAK